MLKRCQNCGAMFETKKGNKKLCGDCKSHKVTSKPKAKQLISVMEMMAIIKKHNRKYGTSYTYGEFVDKLRLNKIVIRNGGSFERNAPHPPQAVPLLPLEKAFK